MLCPGCKTSLTEGESRLRHCCYCGAALASAQAKTHSEVMEAVPASEESSTDIFPQKDLTAVQQIDAVAEAIVAGEELPEFSEYQESESAKVNNSQSTQTGTTKQEIVRPVSGEKQHIADVDGEQTLVDGPEVVAPITGEHQHIVDVDGEQTLVDGSGEVAEVDGEQTLVDEQDTVLPVSSVHAPFVEGEQTIVDPESQQIACAEDELDHSKTMVDPTGQRDFAVDFNNRETLVGDLENEPLVDEDIPVTQRHPQKESFEIDAVIKKTYQIKKLLGKGGMGKVYLAKHLRLQTDVVIKTLLDPGFCDELTLKRFQREAILQAKVDHPNAVSVMDLDQTADGTFYIVMDFARGFPLDKLLKENPPSMEEAIDIGKQILDILAHAHEQNIIHRDLKPQNIMVHKLGGRNHVKILDFGIAKMLGVQDDNTAIVENLTRPQAVLGTLFYMAPEQAAGEEIDFRSDIYAVGVILYKMLGGVLPLEHPKTMVFFNMLLTHEPVPLVQVNAEIPKALSDLVMHALSKEAGQRPQNARDMWRELDSIEKQLSAPPKTPAEFPLWKFVAAVVAISTIGAAVFLYTQRNVRYNKILHAAKTHEQAGDLANAKSLYQQAYDIQNTPEIRRKIATIDTAIESMRKQRQQQQKINVLCREAEAFEEKGLLEEAKQNYSRALAIRKDKKLLAKIEELSKKIEFQQREAKRNRKYRDLLAQVQARIEKNERSKALSLLKQAKNFADDAQKNSIANIRKKLQREIAARKKLQQGQKFHKIHLYKRALSEYRQALRYDKSLAEAHYYIGEIFYERGKYEQARKSFQQALRLRPKYFWALDKLAYVYLDIGDLEAAEMYFRKALAIKTLFADPYNGLGIIYSKQGKYEKAIDALERAEELDPNWLSPKQNLAVVLKKMKRYKSALAIYRQLLEREPQNPDIPYNIGALYLKIKDYYNAYKTLQLYLSLADPTKEREKIRKIKSLVEKLSTILQRNQGRGQ